MPNQDKPDTDPTHAQKFDAALSQILSVSKDELKRREDEYKRQRAAKKRKG